MLHARRDDRGAAREPDRAGARRRRPPARRRPIGHLHLAPDDRDRRGLRPGHGAARGRDRRRRRRERRAPRTGSSSSCSARSSSSMHGGRGARPRRRRRRRPARRPASTARDLTDGTKLHDVSFELLPRRGARRGRARGPGPGRAVRHPRRLRATERRRAARRRLARLVPPPGRRDPGRPRLRRRRPRRGAADAALGPREHRPAVHDPHRAAGARSTSAGEGTTVDAAVAQAPDRRPRRRARSAGSPAATSRR